MEEQIRVEDGFTVIRLENRRSVPLYTKGMSNKFPIQLHFVIKGNARFLFCMPNDRLDLKEQKSLLLYRPQQQLPVDLELAPNSVLVSVIVSFEKLHQLFAADTDYIAFLTPQSKNTRYYHHETISPSMAIVLSHLVHCNVHPHVKNLYYKGKGYELLSLYFNGIKDPDIVKSLFPIDRQYALKIKKAKEIIIANLAEPLSVSALAFDIGLTSKDLKTGFRQLYGHTVYGFVFDYKMESARKLLESGSFNVNEVGLKIGYSSGGHFIVAFKKKFATTPKKYLQSIIAIT
jgi:AraC-like DNA-binding protein